MASDRLDPRTALEVALSSAVGAMGAAAGRARLAGSPSPSAFEGPLGAADALVAAERPALAGRRAYKFRDGWWALGMPLRGERDPLGAITVCRREVPFLPEEGELLADLAAQTSASLEAIALHQRFRGEVTGLVGRRRFERGLDARVEQSLRSGSPLSVLLVDVDDLPRVHAAFGRRAADGVLQGVADTVRRRCRIADEPARVANQRIAVALPGADLDLAWRTAELLREAIAHRELRVRGWWLSVTASIGIADLSQRHGVLFAARSALNEAKRAGGNRSVSFSELPLPRR
jgi:diguanylate cyclase (GGDEF)-like protein